MKKKLFTSLVLFVSMIGMTSVNASYTNTQFGLANGILHDFAKSTSYDNFQFKDYGTKITTFMSSRFTGSLAVNTSPNYAFDSVFTSVPGQSVTAVDYMTQTAAQHHGHYASSYSQ